jgi:Fic family protein
VIGPINEIIEINNAYEIYAKINEMNPYSIDDLLIAHKTMTKGLINESGTFRSKNEGVFDENGNAVHIAPPPNLVPKLINNLFEWLIESNLNPLIKSSIFHYEFEFIHPFVDGNGRMGRFWQALLLSKYKNVFSMIPIETIIYKRQYEYYEAIKLSNSKGNSNDFIIFMLKAILESINDFIKDYNKMNLIPDNVNKLLDVLGNNKLSVKEMMDKLNLKSRDNFNKIYLKPAINLGLVQMIDVNNKTSKNQKYYRT